MNRGQAMASKSAMLLFAAGENPKGSHLVKLPPEENTRKSACRDTIRKHMIDVNPENLFTLVPQLPLPSNLKSLDFIFRIKNAVVPTAEQKKSVCPFVK